MIMYTESFTKWLQPAVNPGAEASNQNIEKSIVVTRYMPLPDVWGTLSEFFKRIWLRAVLNRAKPIWRRLFIPSRFTQALQ
jgi:hypothetical protein